MAGTCPREPEKYPRPQATFRKTTQFSAAAHFTCRVPSCRRSTSSGEAALLFEFFDGGDAQGGRTTRTDGALHATASTSARDLSPLIQSGFSRLASVCSVCAQDMVHTRITLTAACTRDSARARAQSSPKPPPAPATLDARTCERRGRHQATPTIAHAHVLCARSPPLLSMLGRCVGADFVISMCVCVPWLRCGLRTCHTHHVRASWPRFESQYGLEGPE